MAQVINTNIASLTAQRNLNASQRQSDTALQRLSSGLRINSARDDAAGLAISSRFDAQIRGSNQAIRNSGDAISLAQTAEGALASISTSLQRMRELSLQSANDTNTAIDRQALQEEVSQLIAEIKNVSDTSNFNGKKLLDGSLSSATFQTGANVGETISFSIGEVGTTSLGAAEAVGLSSKTRVDAVINGSDGSALVAGDLIINGVSVSASIGSDDGASSGEARSSAIAKAAAVNRITDLTGVTATADANYVRGSTAAINTAPVTVDLTINGVDFQLGNTTEQTVLQNLQNTAAAINAESGQTGVTAVAGEYGSQGLTLIADDGRNIAISSTLAAAASDTAAQNFGLLSAGTSEANADVYLGTYTLSSSTGDDIVLTTDTTDIDNSGFEEGTFSGVNSGAISDSGYVNGSASTTLLNSLETGDLVINNVTIGKTDDSLDTSSFDEKANSAISKAAAINAVSDRTGVTAEAGSTRLYSGTIVATTLASNITINGVSVAISFNSTDDIDVKLSAVIEAVNATTGQTGVSAKALDGDSFTLAADDGRNITYAGGTALSEIEAQTYVGSVALKGGGDIDISTTTNNIENWGFRIGEFGGSTNGSLLEDLDISTVEGANAAILAVDNALTTISTVSAQLGAIQNRFDSVISNLELRSENLSAANSRILDADFASETAALTKSQVLQQAGITILSQANARPQQVLSLLG